MEYFYVIDTIIGHIPTDNPGIDYQESKQYMQKETLIELVTKLNDLGFDITLYTGHQKEDVPSILLDKVKYLKTGNFIQELKTTVKPFVGSENQVFEEVK